MGAPISTTLIVFELTGDDAITISLMGSVALATLLTHSMIGKSFFHWQLSRRGYADIKTFRSTSREKESAALRAARAGHRALQHDRGREQETRRVR